MPSSRLSHTPVLFAVALTQCVATTPERGTLPAQTASPTTGPSPVPRLPERTKMASDAPCQSGTRTTCEKPDASDDNSDTKSKRMSTLSDAMQPYERSCLNGHKNACIKGGKFLAERLGELAAPVTREEFTSAHRHTQTLLTEGCDQKKLQEHCLLKVEIYCTLHRLEKKAPAQSQESDARVDSDSAINNARAAMENLLSSPAAKSANSDLPDRIADACKISRTEVFSMLSFPER